MSVALVNYCPEQSYVQELDSQSYSLKINVIRQQIDASLHHNITRPAASRGNTPSFSPQEQLAANSCHKVMRLPPVSSIRSLQDQGRLFPIAATSCHGVVPLPPRSSIHPLQGRSFRLAATSCHGVVALPPRSSIHPILQRRSFQLAATSSHGGAPLPPRSSIHPIPGQLFQSKMSRIQAQAEEWPGESNGRSLREFQDECVQQCKRLPPNLTAFALLRASNEKKVCF